MAVSFTQQPSTPNGSQSTIIYGLQGLATASQAKYVCDVVDSDTSTQLVRIKQPANESGYGVFEISDILHDYMDYDETWTITSPVTSSNYNARTFSIQFGEEYGTSPSSSVTVYPNQVNQTIEMYPAVTDTIDGFNWPSASYDDKWLTSHPQGMYMRPEDYGTLSRMNIASNYVDSITIVVFDADSNPLAVKTITNPYPYTSYTDSQSKLIHFPIGPANFKDDSILGFLSTGSAWDNYLIVTTPETETELVVNSNVYTSGACSGENGTRFAFINRQGVWDYWTASLTKTERESYQQDTYEQTFVDFSTENGLIPFNKSRRGTTIYNKAIQSNYSAQTDWLDKQNADYLVELFESPSVYVQYENGFISVIITNTQIDKKRNPRGQKLFTYRIEYTLANPKKSRR